MNPAETARSIEQELDGFLRAKAKEIDRFDSAGELLLKKVARLIEAGGSRIRPLLCVTAHRGCGGAFSPEIFRVAASFELLHTFALIHDDLIDGAGERRGAATVVKEDATATAVLAGDLAFALSDELYFESGFDPSILVRAFRRLAQARLKALTGQYLELISAPSKDAYLPSQIARLKTSSYSLVAPLTVGAELAGASSETLDALSEFGEVLGVAYQIRDDLLLFDPTSQKDVAADMRNGRPNALISEILRRADASQTTDLMLLWGAPEGSTDEIARLRQMADEVGAPESMATRIRSLVVEAKDALQRCHPDEVHPETLGVLNNLAESISN